MPVAQAELVRRRYQADGVVDLDLIVASEHITVIRFPFEGGVHEAIFQRTPTSPAYIGVDDRITNIAEVRYLTAHALGHHYMHRGNQLCLLADPLTSPIRQRQETEANVFAAHLLIPDQAVSRVRNYGELLDLADAFSVPAYLILRRLHEFG